MAYSVGPSRVVRSSPRRSSTSFIDLPAVSNGYSVAVHKAFAREAASKCAVLLKNEKGVLPLKAGVKVAVLGYAACDDWLIRGTWTVYRDHADRLTLFEGLRDLGVDCSQAICYGMKRDEKAIDEEAIRRACAKTDVIVASFGLNRIGGEASSRCDLSLAPCERRAAEIISQSGKLFVAVLFSGIPLALGELSSRADAVLQAWGAGSSAGIGIADVLTGRVEPYGRLTCDFPHSAAQCPVYYNHLPTGRPHGAHAHFAAQYMDGPVLPLYPFGYGLTYTRFSYADVSATEDGGEVVLSCRLANVGDRSGSEVVQAYVRRLFDGRSHPIRELKGFRRVFLSGGESSRVEIRLGVPPGDYDFFLAGDSRSGDAIRLTVCTGR